MDKATLKIIATAQDRGNCHDFKLFKTSKTRMHPTTKTMTDTGYLGIKTLHGKAELPKKRSKHHPLTKADKASNRAIAKQRVPCENVIGALKVFAILSDRYRNRRKRFGLRFSLISGLYNANLSIC